MFSLMVGVGLRVGEVASLCLSNIESPIEPNSLARLRVCGKGDKERIVWLTPSLWDSLQAWLHVRPDVDTDYLFLNHREKPIKVNGIQYRLACHCKAANVTLSCHQLRHTFGRRMAESGLAVDSLAKLLGHEQLQTTQRYINGANPIVRADFAQAMEKLETNLIRDQVSDPLPVESHPAPKREAAPEAELSKLIQRLDDWPEWLGGAAKEFLRWRWPTWRASTAYKLGGNFVSLLNRFRIWLTENQPYVVDWSTFHRADLQAWLTARHQDDVGDTTIRGELGQLRSLLRFLESRDYVIDPALFRVRSPKLSDKPLPRYLPESDYRWLETNILQATQEATYDNCFDRAWFLMLAHTGVRLSELLDLRLGDLNLKKGYATIRNSKHQRDRVVFLTSRLANALTRYLHQRPKLANDDHLFLLHERLPSERTIQRRLTEYGKQVGVAVFPHRLRHTFATSLINQGMPIESLKRLLGHQYLNTTQVYARIYDQTLYDQFKEAMSHLEPAIGTQEAYILEEFDKQPSLS